MSWEMVERTRPYKTFPGFEFDDEAPTVGVWDEERQKMNTVVNVSIIAERMAANGQRPPASAKCPPVMYLLMQACWVHDAPKRPTAADVLQMIRTMLTDAQQHLLARDTSGSENVVRIIDEILAGGVWCPLQTPSSNPERIRLLCVIRENTCIIL